MEVKGQREGSVGQVIHIHTAIALDTGRSWRARAGRSLRPPRMWVCDSGQGDGVCALFCKDSPF